jgi:hypothetical protein
MSIENTNANAIPISLSKIIFQTFLQLQEVSGEAAAVKKRQRKYPANLPCPHHLSLTLLMIRVDDTSVMP